MHTLRPHSLYIIIIGAYIHILYAHVRMHTRTYASLQAHTHARPKAHAHAYACTHAQPHNLYDTVLEYYFIIIIIMQHLLW